jgi:hypothetical protein
MILGVLVLVWSVLDHWYPLLGGLAQHLEVRDGVLEEAILDFQNLSHGLKEIEDFLADSSLSHSLVC